jgi:hypothetical protein
MNNTAQQTKSETKISLYPNPTSDCFQISGLIGAAMLIISDLHCRVLLKKEVNSEESICLRKLPKGVYIAKISSESGVVERKLVKH